MNKKLMIGLIAFVCVVSIVYADTILYRFPQESENFTTYSVPPLFSNSGRVMRSWYENAYNLYGYANTYNGISCTASTLSILSSKWMVRAYADGAGANVCDASVVSFPMPEDYESGTDIIVSIHWSSGAVAGAVSWGVGLQAVGENESYIGAEKYVTKVIPVKGVAYSKMETMFNFSGAGIVDDDDVSIVVYRYGDDAGDTLSGNAILHMVGVYYVSNKRGEEVWEWDAAAATTP